jgi:hypothetical protein
MNSKLILPLLSVCSVLISHVEGSELTSFRCSEVEGAKIIAENGTYLGTLDDNYQTDSIFNDFSDHGSSYGQESIWNEYSEHGDSYSSGSPFNEYAADAPVLLKDGEVVGRLTTSQHDSTGVNPNSVGKECGWQN